MRTVVVTGSASGIGAAVRSTLEAEGQRVIGVDIRNADVEADLSTTDGRNEAVTKALDLSGGTLDGVVICAGLGPHVQPPSLMISVNYFGAVEVLDGLQDALSRGDNPAAVVISSNSIGIIPMVLPSDDTEMTDAMIAGDEPTAIAAGERFDGASIYGMTKVALARAIRHRTQDWGEKGIRLNAVAPGPVKTPLLQGSLDDPILRPGVEGLPVPLGRHSEPQEIADVISFLMGPKATYVHGSIVFIDGGTDALMRPDHT